jgi:hypothetical protein
LRIAGSLPRRSPVPRGPLVVLARRVLRQTGAVLGRLTLALLLIVIAGVLAPIFADERGHFDPVVRHTTWIGDVRAEGQAPSRAPDGSLLLIAPDVCRLRLDEPCGIPR